MFTILLKIKVKNETKILKEVQNISLCFPIVVFLDLFLNNQTV